MKRLCCLLMVLCLLPCAALADDGDLPDIEAFSGGLLKIDPDETDENDFRVDKMYRGMDDDVLQVANAYIELIQEKYNLDEMCHFPIVSSGVTRMRWAFTYTKDSPEMGSNNIWIESQDWKISGYQVLVEYTQSEEYSDEYLRILYRPEFNYNDTGDRMEAVSPKPTSKPEVECSECNGTGKCQTCGGDMWYWGWEWKYVNGSPESVQVNKMCDAVYCYGGSCDKCGGDGVL